MGKQKTMQLDKENKDLVGAAKNVRDTFEPNMKQQKMFSSLKNLLDAKNRIYRVASGEEMVSDGQLQQQRQGQNANMMALDMADVGSGGKSTTKLKTRADATQHNKLPH